MAALPTALDDLDDATAELILNLHQQDLAEFGQLHNASGTASHEHDGDIAWRYYEAELSSYRALRGFEARPAPVIAPPPPEPRTQCTWCMEDFPVSQTCSPASIACGHTHCHECLRRLFNDLLRDESLYPPRCCTHELAYEDVRTALTPQLATRFEAKREELGDKDRIYCHAPTCSAYIPAIRREGGIANCPSCPEATCTTCNSAAHLDRDCPQDAGTQSVLAIATNEGWTQCSKCRRMVELSEGCNHITCFCSHQFCYICGTEWRNCECPQFTAAHLLQRANLIQGRQEEGAGQNLEELMRDIDEHHNCEHADTVRVNGRHQCDRCDAVLPNFIMQCRTCFLRLCYRCRFNRPRVAVD